MLEGIFTVFGTLVVVILILYLAYVSTKFIGKSTRIRGHSRNIKLIDQLPVGQDRSIAVVKAGGKYLLLGIASAQITVLKELDEEEVIEYSPDAEQEMKLPDFKEMMERVKREINRKK